ncbi:PTS system mannose/fructose/sorbose family transporter subunit IID, partial [Clostridium saccharobutylicum]
YGYEKGTQLVSDMAGNKLRYLTEGASVLGLLVIGGLVSKWTTVNIPFVLSQYTKSDGTQVTTTIQSVLDSLMPGLVPLLLTFLCMYLLKKKVNPLLIIFGLFAVGILGVACGVLQ